MKRIISTLLTVLMCTALMSGCLTPASETPKSEPAKTEASKAEAPKAGEASKPQELPALRVAIMPYMNCLPVQYLIDKGWDVQNGFKLQVSMLSLGAPMLEALGANQWDAGSIGAAAVFGVANYDAKVIGDTLLSSGAREVFVRSDSPIAKVKGYNKDYPNVYGDPNSVKGKTIITATGAMVHLALLKWIEIIGLTEKDVRIVHMDTNQQYQAFKAGQGDIICFTPPMNYNARKEGWSVVATMSDMKYPIYDTLIANSRTYNQKKDLIVKFVKQYYRAIDELIADKKMLAEKQLKFQNDNGLKSEMDGVLKEIESRPLVSSKEALELAKAGKIGETVKAHAHFQAGIGKIEKDKLSKFSPSNLVNEIILEALK